ncbi:hypothetical protein POM88_007189 [Heracleum sosnowskyi]|uniref:Aminotransferase-like plant mobile domain-containing protein n=1 Tax=Heracleum sosnowskyi TaxID=360622 RepID=A0AAD8J4Y8_9APIA|nr:hypothetical protein POM88_007189 [Heracleum sosnowskyi]
MFFLFDYVIDLELLVLRIMSSSVTIVNDCEDGDCVQQQSSRTSGVPVAPSNATTTQASGRHKGNIERARGNTSLARADGQPSSTEANVNSTRSRRTTPSQVIEDDITPVERAISQSLLVRDRVQKQAPGTSGVPVSPSKTTTTQASGRLQENRNRSRGNTSLVRADGQPSSTEANANSTRSRRTARRRVIEDDITPAERAISRSLLVRDRVQQQDSSTSGVPVSPSHTTTTQPSGRLQENRKRSRGSTSLARADVQPSSTEANANSTRSSRTTPRRVIEDDTTPAERAIWQSLLVRDPVQQQASSTSGVPVSPSNTTTTQASGRLQENRKRSHGRTRVARADGQPSSTEANSNSTRSRRATPRRVIEDDITPAERAISQALLVRDRVQQQASSTYGVPVSPSNTTTTQSSGRLQENRKRSRGSTSLARADGQPSPTEANANSTRSRRITPKQVIEDDITPVERTISESLLFRGATNAPLPLTGRGQWNRSISRRNTSSSRTCERPGSSSAGAEEPDISSETADIEPGSRDARDEDDLTPAERNISGTQLLSNLGNHPSVYARAGLNPRMQGLSFRGAWKRAIDLYRVANDEYKQLFIRAGFGDFLKIDPVELPQGYIIALTERWFAETNTIHLPCCEIGPTPLDWTMITGLRFVGRRIKLDVDGELPKEKEEKVRKLLGLDRADIFSGTRIKLSAVRPKKELVEAVPPSNEARERTFRRLFLYVIGSCFFGNNQSVIHHELVEFLENINTVGTYDWGAITFAAFLSGMRRKVTRQIGSFTAFWQFLPFWAFEYLNICRPEHSEVNDFPRATRWKFPQNLGTLDNSELTASRCQLDYVDDESKVTWQPYLASEKYNSGDNDIATSIMSANKRVPFIGFDTWEYYLGERCQRQLGLPCLVPSDPPEMMHGLSKDYPDDDTSMVSSAQNLVSNESLDYASWFTDNSIGKIVDVTRLIGGTDIGRKVIGHWMAKYRPGMILVPESEVEEMKQARDTADAARKKLQEELKTFRFVREELVCQALGKVSSAMTDPKYMIVSPRQTYVWEAIDKLAHGLS